jgi:hypothetical protein
MQDDARRAWFERNRDLVGREGLPWVRRLGLLFLLAFVVAALLNVFGQRAEDSSASAPAATLELNAPSNARGGLIFQARFEIHATEEIKQPLLILDRGWFDGLTMNTTVPDPSEQRTDNGRVVFEYDTIPAGRSLVVWLQFQVNPTRVGSEDQDVELWDGETKLLHLDHSLGTFP